MRGSPARWLLTESTEAINRWNSGLSSSVSVLAGVGAGALDFLGPLPCSCSCAITALAFAGIGRVIGSHGVCSMSNFEDFSCFFPFPLANCCGAVGAVCCAASCSTTVGNGLQAGWGISLIMYWIIRASLSFSSALVPELVERSFCTSAMILS